MQIAQIENPFKNIQIPTSGNPPFNINSQNLSIGEVVGAILPYLFTVAGLLLLLYLIYGGLSLMLSRGDPKAVQSAKDKITGALVGFIIVFASYWIVQIVASILGLQSSVGKIFGIQ